MSSPLKRFAALFSPPRRIPTPKDEDHNKNSTQTGISPRCQFTFSDGRQCRDQQTHLCVHHSSRRQQGFGAEGAPDAVLEAPALEGLCGDLTTATNINRALAQVYLLMAQGRISQKQAVAFGYLSQLLLQTVPGIRSEFVSVHGYKSWENRLKSSLTEKSAEAPEPSPDHEGGGEGQEEQASEANGEPMNEVVEPEKVLGRERSAHESHANQELSCDQKGDQELRGPEEVTSLLAHEKAELEEGEYYADIYRRSLDLLDRKFDTTPEGRSEAKALLLELELMKPAPEKPRRDFFGQTADLLRRGASMNTNQRSPHPPRPRPKRPQLPPSRPCPRRHRLPRQPLS
jgi:hypothetical protein